MGKKYKIKSNQKSKFAVDSKILFGKITHHLDPEIRKMLAGNGFIWEREFQLRS